MTNEIHILKPFLPYNTQVLMLGSFPPPRTKWCMEFYYPNFINDMWRIFGIVFFKNKEYFIKKDIQAFDKDKIINFLSQVGIGVGDSVIEAIRLKDNASDNFLQVIKALDLNETLAKIPHCHSIITTGEKATDTILSILPCIIQKPKIGSFESFELSGHMIKFYRLPSSSRAYPKSINEKAKIYASVFHDLGILK